MTDSQVFAWILLSVPDRGGKLKELIAAADALNHAVPTPDELQRSLGWLQNRGYVLKEAERKYRLTDLGTELLARDRSANKTPMQMWDAVTEDLDSLVGDEVPLDDISVEEVKHAYEAYRKEFRKRF